MFSTHTILNKVGNIVKNSKTISLAQQLNYIFKM